MTTDTLTPSVARDVLAATLAMDVPDVYWLVGDDLCDCAFQRIGEWANPYTARTQRYRLCCMWARIIEALGLGEYVQEIPAYYDGNRHRYVTEPREWDSEEMPMPLDIWYRQLAAKEGKTLAQVREQYAGREYERPQPLPPGTAIQDEPTEAELHHALEERLRAATWILPEERLA